LDCTMSVSLEAFQKRAAEAEQKLKSLQAQIDALTADKGASSSSSADDAKSSGDAWEVIYWPLKNRGNFVKLVLEEAGVAYTCIEDMAQLKAAVRSTKVGTQTYDEGGPFQVMAPPVLRNGDLILSQGITIMGYLADKFKIRPKRLEDHARAQNIANNANDCLSEMYGQQHAAKAELFAFARKRLQVWLDIFEKPLKSRRARFYFEDRCTQADLAVFNLLDGLEELMGPRSFDALVVRTHAYLNEYYQRLKARKSIKALMDKQQGVFCYAPGFGWKGVRAFFREGEEVGFQSDGVVPDVVDGEPAALLTVEYGAVKIDAMAQTLTPTQVRAAPTRMAFAGCDAAKLYTLVLTDPDAKDREKHEFREWVHCVRVNVSGGALCGSGDEIVEYVGSGPPPNTGLHRYVWLVYEQAARIEPGQCGQDKLKSGGGGGKGRQCWKARKFVSDNKLGPLVAGTFYNAEYDEFVPKLYAWLQKGKMPQ